MPRSGFNSTPEWRSTRIGVGGAELGRIMAGRKSHAQRRMKALASYRRALDSSRLYEQLSADVDCTLLCPCRWLLPPPAKVRSCRVRGKAWKRDAGGHVVVPVQRQIAKWRHGIELSRQDMAGWVGLAADWLR